MNNIFRTYLFSYQHDGASWCIEIPAENPQDAQDRVAKLAYAIYEGEVVTSVPAELGLLARLGVLARNSLKALFPTRSA
jgi:hypothetical protein